jgi:hypothetical protein
MKAGGGRIGCAGGTNTIAEPETTLHVAIFRVTGLVRRRRNPSGVRGTRQASAEPVRRPPTPFGKDLDAIWRLRTAKTLSLPLSALRRLRQRVSSPVPGASPAVRRRSRSVLHRFLGYFAHNLQNESFARRRASSAGCSLTRSCCSRASFLRSYSSSWPYCGVAMNL